MNERPRVLVLDDEEAIALLLGRAMRGSAVDVDTASSPEHALQLAEEQAYCLFVSDFRMPGMTGLEFARRIAAIRPAASVLVISAFLDPAAQADLDAQTNVVGVVRKPFDLFDLRARIERLAGVPDAAGESLQADA